MIAMLPETFLLRFEDRPHAIAVLDAIGVEFDAVCGDGIIRLPTGETVEFEGESIAITCPLSGYHVRLIWWGELPHALQAYLAPRDTPVSSNFH